MREWLANHGGAVGSGRRERKRSWQTNDNLQFVVLHFDVHKAGQVSVFTFNEVHKENCLSQFVLYLFLDSDTNVFQCQILSFLSLLRLHTSSASEIIYVYKSYTIATFSLASA